MRSTAHKRDVRRNIGGVFFKIMNEIKTISRILILLECIYIFGRTKPEVFYIKELLIKINEILKMSKFTKKDLKLLINQYANFDKSTFYFKKEMYSLFAKKIKNIDVYKLYLLKIIEINTQIINYITDNNINKAKHLCYAVHNLPKYIIKGDKMNIENILNENFFKDSFEKQIVL